jgi:hypothetical protein
MNPYQSMYQSLKGQYNPEQGYNPEEGIDPEELIRRRRRMMLANPMFQTLGFQQPQQQQDPGMASDIFKAIGNPLTGMIPGILSAIFKKRS